MLNIYVNMEGLKKILDINDVYLTRVIDYYNSENFQSKRAVNINHIIYNENSDSKYAHNLSTTDEIINHQIKDDLINFISNLKKIFNLNILFYFEYTQKGEVNFHVDNGLNRHILPLNDDDKFYNYECLIEKNVNEKRDIYHNMRNNYPEKFDEFNEFFLNDSELNSIHNLKSGSVYTIGDSLHAFINNSNKIRVNLVFEVNPKLI